MRSATHLHLSTPFKEPLGPLATPPREAKRKQEASADEAGDSSADGGDCNDNLLCLPFCRPLMGWAGRVRRRGWRGGWPLARCLSDALPTLPGPWVRVRVRVLVLVLVLLLVLMLIMC